MEFPHKNGTSLEHHVKQLIKWTFEQGFNASSEGFNNSHFTRTGLDDLIRSEIKFQNMSDKFCHKWSGTIDMALRSHRDQLAADAVVDAKEDLKDKLAKFLGIEQDGY